jgi:hypothetical protein
VTARRCNECTLCCRLLPIAEIGKAAGTVCTQQRSKGCRVYGTQNFPRSCGLWSCAWLVDESIQLPRPDRAHYVIDTMPEFIEVEGMTASVVQIWIDPRYPNAHRDPALRAWLATRWVTHEQLGLVRLDSKVSIALFPPGVIKDGWYEQGGRANVPQHSAAQVVETLRAWQRERRGG